MALFLTFKCFVFQLIALYMMSLGKQEHLVWFSVLFIYFSIPPPGCPEFAIAVALQSIIVTLHVVHFIVGICLDCSWLEKIMAVADQTALKPDGKFSAEDLGCCGFSTRDR